MNTAVKKKPKTATPAGDFMRDHFKIHHIGDAVENESADNELQVSDKTVADKTLDAYILPLTPDPDAGELERLRVESGYYDDWRKKVNGIVQQIDAAKAECKHWSNNKKELETDLRDLLLKGPETMHGRPLLDEIEKNEPDPELWRQTPIAELSIPLKWSHVTAEHFANAGQLVDWLNTHPREKKKGLGKKAVESLEEAVNLLHEPVIQEQLESAERKDQSAKCDDAEHKEQDEPDDSIFDPDEDFGDDDCTWVEEEETEELFDSGEESD